jgi:hypothetical protein
VGRDLLALCLLQTWSATELVEFFAASRTTAVLKGVVTADHSELVYISGALD